MFCAEAAELLLGLNYFLEVLGLYTCYVEPELKNALWLRLGLCRCPRIPGAVNLPSREISVSKFRELFLINAMMFVICFQICYAISKGTFVEKLLQDTLCFFSFSKVRFDSIGGLSHHILALKEMVVFPLLYPEVFEKFKIQPPR